MKYCQFCPFMSINPSIHLKPSIFAATYFVSILSTVAKKPGPTARETDTLWGYGVLLVYNSTGYHLWLVVSAGSSGPPALQQQARSCRPHCTHCRTLHNLPLLDISKYLFYLRDGGGGSHSCDLTFQDPPAAMPNQSGFKLTRGRSKFIKYFAVKCLKAKLATVVLDYSSVEIQNLELFAGSISEGGRGMDLTDTWKKIGTQSPGKVLQPVKRGQRLKTLPPAPVLSAQAGPTFFLLCCQQLGPVHPTELRVQEFGLDLASGGMGPGGNSHPLLPHQGLGASQSTDCIFTLLPHGCLARPPFQGWVFPFI